MFSKNNGFTLIEIIIFIVVFSLGVVGIMTLFYNTLGNTSDPVVRDRGIQVAQAVMEEVFSKKWDAKTPNGGGEIDYNNSTIGTEAEDSSLENYDDVDDYNGVNCKTCEANCFNTMTCGFNVKIYVEYAKIDSNGNILGNSSTKTNYKLITVEVSGNGLNETYKLYAVKANF